MLRLTRLLKHTRPLHPRAMAMASMTTETPVNTISPAATTPGILPAQSSNSLKKEVPAGYKVHREASAEVLLAEGRDVFINPIQEFNRDLSTLTIRTWSELVNEEKQAKWERKKQNAALTKGKKRKHEEDEGVTEPAESAAHAAEVSGASTRQSLRTG